MLKVTNQFVLLRVLGIIRIFSVQCSFLSYFCIFQELSSAFLFNLYHSVDKFTYYLADDKLMIVYLPENRMIYFLGDNLHEISKPIFWEK